MQARSRSSWWITIPISLGVITSFSLAIVVGALSATDYLENGSWPSPKLCESVLVLLRHSFDPFWLQDLSPFVPFSSICFPVLAPFHLGSDDSAISPWYRHRNGRRHLRGDADTAQRNANRIWSSPENILALELRLMRGHYTIHHCRHLRIRYQQPSSGE